MSRIAIPDSAEVPAEARPLLEAVVKRLGFVPNLSRLMSLSPTVLSAVTNFQAALGKTLDVKTRDGIALAVSDTNGCGYCLAAHSYVASKFAKVSLEEIARNRRGESEDPKRSAAVRFAKRLVESRGRVDDVDLKAVRDAGYADPQIIEIAALSVQFLLTNFLNNLAGTETDFPGVEPVATPSGERN